MVWLAIRVRRHKVENVLISLYMTWSLQSLEDSQLSCTAKLETVVCSDVGQLSLNARLKEGGRQAERSEVKSNASLSV